MHRRFKGKNTIELSHSRTYHIPCFKIIKGLFVRGSFYFPRAERELNWSVERSGRVPLVCLGGVKTEVSLIYSGTSLLLAGTNTVGLIFNKTSLSFFVYYSLE